jgi:hypothetical protein
MEPDSGTTKARLASGKHRRNRNKKRKKDPALSMAIGLLENPAGILYALPDGNLGEKEDGMSNSKADSSLPEREGEAAKVCVIVGTGKRGFFNSRCSFRKDRGPPLLSSVYLRLGEEHVCSEGKYLRHGVA